MQEFGWSQREKKAARNAFDRALRSEIGAIRREIETMLARSQNPFEIWRVHDYLSEKRREIDEKYDYRYSVLISVLGCLVSEGWLTEADLGGLHAEKLEAIRRVVSSLRG